MFEGRPTGSAVVSRLLDALRQLAAVEGEFLALDPAVLSHDELLNLLDVLESGARRQTAMGCALIAELDTRGVAGELASTSTAVLLSERLRIGRREAAARTRLAAEVAPRRALTGEMLPPRFPQVAAALADRVISARHAAVVAAAVNALPDRVLDDQPDLAGQVEPILVEHARTLDPDRLAVLARSVMTCLDRTGGLPRTPSRPGAGRPLWSCCRTGPAGWPPLSPAKPPRCGRSCSTRSAARYRPASVISKIGALLDSGVTTRYWTPAGGCCAPARCRTRAAPPPPC